MGISTGDKVLHTAVTKLYQTVKFQWILELLLLWSMEKKCFAEYIVCFISLSGLKKINSFIVDSSYEIVIPQVLKVHGKIITEIRGKYKINN